MLSHVLKSCTIFCNNDYEGDIVISKCRNDIEIPSTFHIHMENHFMYIETLRNVITTTDKLIDIYKNTLFQVNSLNGADTEGLYVTIYGKDDMGADNETAISLEDIKAFIERYRRDRLNFELQEKISNLNIEDFLNIANILGVCNE